MKRMRIGWMARLLEGWRCCVGDGKIVMRKDENVKKELEIK